MSETPGRSDVAALRRLRWFIREWRIGWNQGAINRAEATLARLGGKPHRAADCAACQRRMRR